MNHIHRSTTARTLLASIISCFLLVPASARAGEIHGTVDLGYPPFTAESTLGYPERMQELSQKVWTTPSGAEIWFHCFRINLAPRGYFTLKRGPQDKTYLSMRVVGRKGPGPLTGWNYELPQYPTPIRNLDYLQFFNTPYPDDQAQFTMFVSDGKGYGLAHIMDGTIRAAQNEGCRLSYWLRS